MLFFSVGLALATVVLFGLWPALQLSRAYPRPHLQSNDRRMAGSIRGRKAHNVLIAGQIALTLLLFAASGAATEGFVRLLHQPLGYDPHNVNRFRSRFNRVPIRGGLRARLISSSFGPGSQRPGVSMTAISTNATPPIMDRMPFEILGDPRRTSRRPP